jgi:phage replication-related protein YjqB (UPF0714/DUF867 family)
MKESTARGKYGSFAELSRHETEGRDYRIEVLERPNAAVLVAAPHGGMIEAGTSQIAAAIAGLKPYGENRALHITSHRFDHPKCLELAARSALVLGVHGCLGDSRIHVGGLDSDAGGRIAEALAAAGFQVEWPSSRYPGLHPSNICNLGTSAKGVQIEVTYDLRASGCAGAIACAVRAGLASPGGSAGVAAGRPRAE